jgi:hypothetical protein
MIKSETEQWVDVVYHYARDDYYDILKVQGGFKVKAHYPRWTEDSQVFDDIAQAKEWIEKDIAKG